jgi:hypothetical protein
VVLVVIVVVVVCCFVVVWVVVVVRVVVVVVIVVMGEQLWAHVVAIDTNGIVWAGGDSTVAQYGYTLSQGDTTDSWVQVAATTGNTYLLSASGQIKSFGVDAQGQLGTILGDFDGGYDTVYFSPVQIPGSWVQVKAANTADNIGGSYEIGSYLAKRVDGTLWFWGIGFPDSSALGKTTYGAIYISPVQVNGSWSQFAPGDGFFLAIN